MNKRGQVTIFIILGIILVAIIGFVLVLTQTNVNLKRFIPVQTVSLSDHIEGCIEDTGNKALDLIGKQGGDINPALFQPYLGNSLTYLCYTDSFLPCSNRQPFLAQHIENEIKNYINAEIKNCIDLSLFSNKGYTVQANSFTTNIAIGTYNTVITLDYPITITKGDITESKQRFAHTFNIPLGRLTEVANDIVKVESLGGDFNNLAYMLKTQNNIKIEKQTTLGSKIYILSYKNNPYIFQFATRSWVG